MARMVSYPILGSIKTSEYQSHQGLAKTNQSSLMLEPIWLLLIYLKKGFPSPYSFLMCCISSPVGLTMEYPTLVKWSAILSNSLNNVEWNGDNSFLH